MNYISPWVQTTNECNLACSYCYIKQNKDIMGDEIYEALSSQLSCMLEDYDNINIRVAGGEPLLAFSKWRKGFEWLLANKKVCIDVITNLSFIPNGFIDYAKRDDVFVSVSLDGLMYSKPFKNGVSSSVCVIDNINTLVANNVKPMILTVINNNNINQLVELAHYIFPLGLHWRISLDYYYNNNPDYRDIMVVLSKIAKLINNYNYPYHKIRFNHCGDVKQDGCTAGEGLFAINTNGDIYQCQTLFQGKPFGNIKHNRIIDVLSPIKHLSCHCSITEYCSGRCPLHYNGVMGDLACLMSRHFITELLGTKINAMEGYYAKL